MNTADTDICCLEGGGLPGPLYSVGDVASVLDVAHPLVVAGHLPPWASCLARSQSQGRGQMRRHWHSPEGNVYAVLRLPAQEPFVGSEAALAVGALVAAALQDMLGSEHQIRLKWPNDVVLLRQGQPAKLGGILLEERGGAVLAGMGINAAHAPAAQEMRRDRAMPAVALSQVWPAWEQGGQEQAEGGLAGLSPVERLWARLVSGIYFWYTKKLAVPCQWRDLAEDALLWKGRAVNMDDEGRQRQGVLLGLAPSGALRIKVQGQVEEFLSGSLAAGNSL